MYVFFSNTLTPDRQLCQPILLHGVSGNIWSHAILSCVCVCVCVCVCMCVCVCVIILSLQCCEKGGAVHGRCAGGQPRQSPREPAGQWRSLCHQINLFLDHISRDVHIVLMYCNC